MGVRARAAVGGVDERREETGETQSNEETTATAAAMAVEEESSSGADEGSRVGRWGQRLLKYHSAPDYIKDNEFILRYYRAPALPLKETVLSIFTLHNETLNIWTHLLGFFLFLGLTIYTAIKLPQVAESGLQRFSRLQARRWETIKDDLADMITPGGNGPITRWPFFVFLVGAMFCLLSSSSCHLLMSHSKYLATIMLRVDYIGITILIACSFYPPVYYTFMCTPTFCTIYLLGITTLGIATIIVSMIPTFENVEYRPARALLFVSMGMSGIIPCVHKLRSFSNEPAAMSTLYLELAMGGMYVLGALIYTTRVPERWKPGWFDIAGASHQIFHILVVAGALIHYRAALVYLKWRDIKGCS